MTESAVQLSGGLLSESLLENFREIYPKSKYVQPESFNWLTTAYKDTASGFECRIETVYQDLAARWDEIIRFMGNYDIAQLREKWIKYFFEKLGFNLKYQQSDIAADTGNKFPLSHRGWDDPSAPVIHTVLFSQDLDKKVPDGRHKYSPHDTLQRYLNQTKSNLWGIVTNGSKIRVLRDFHHETRKGYIQFDLNLIFDGRKYSEFRLLYRLLHPSRFVIEKESNKSILESLFNECKLAGIAVGEDLRGNVRQAIENLANGFLYLNPEFLKKLVNNNEECKEFHHQILRVIYRIIFLLYAEQRNLMPIKSSLYFQEYSITALRDKVENGYIGEDSHTDLWEGLKITFEMVYKGVKELGIPAYNGLLFSHEVIETLDSMQCRNDMVLNAIKNLTLIEKGKMTHRISYVELGVDEIGSIYESLLDFMPRVSNKSEVLLEGNKKEKTIPADTFFLDPRGMNRKTSGSYYTNPDLVNALIESALVPVLEEKLNKAGKKKEDREKALLSLDVCDPACGSGAFLIAATEYLGLELAKIRANDDYPDETAIRHARRDVLKHCIYGVDLNPLSVELCKLGLWLTAATEDQPLNFLDHKLKCGNSLVGATPELIRKGIPKEAYESVEGDDKEISKARKKEWDKYAKNKAEHEGQMSIQQVIAVDSTLQATIDIDEMTENSNEEIEALKRKYLERREDKEFLYEKMLADYWTAAFFFENKENTADYPKQEVLDNLIEKTIELKPAMKKKIEAISRQYSFFHWYLEYPEVFKKGGFDCVLGNPPWEKIQIEEEEFFAADFPEIVKIKGQNRKKAIKDLLEKNSFIKQKWVGYQRVIKLNDKFLWSSKSFPMSGFGKMNTYSIFLELTNTICNKNGFFSLVLPTGIATDYENRIIFANFILSQELKELIDFINEELIFPDVAPPQRFCIMSVSKGKKNRTLQVSIGNKKIASVESNLVQLNHEELIMFNPNTNTMPIFNSAYDLEINRKIYRSLPIIQNEKNNKNPFDISINRMINPTDDSDLFYTKESLQKKCTQKGNRYILGNTIYYPAYEAKMMHQYDNRYNTYEGISEEKRFGTKIGTNRPDDTQLSDFSYVVEPRYWIEDKQLDRFIGNKTNKKWFLIYRDITNITTNRRTAIFTMSPIIGAIDPCRVVYFGNNANIKDALLFLANCNSIVFDYLVRQKLSGSHLAIFILKQIPIIPISAYDKGVVKKILDIVSRLLYVSEEFNFLNDELDFKIKQTKWDQLERLKLKCELDATFAQLYMITPKELAYIFDTFSILKNLENEKYGEFISKRITLEIFKDLKSI